MNYANLIGCDNFSLAVDSQFTDIAFGRKFYFVAASTKSEAVWATLRKEHTSGWGYQIAKLDTKNEEWVDDMTQPKGAYDLSLAVDAEGNPAFAARESPQHIWHKQRDVWMEYKVCSV